MSMDTPATESNAPLSVNEAANLFDKPEEEQAEETSQSPEATQAEAEPPQQEEPTTESEKVTIQVDGKTVELTKAELADAYKNGLRQADYTRKTMEAAEQRKAAEAAQNQALQERQRYAMGLQQAQSLLQAQVQEQSQIDWNKLLETDPVEYLKQQHLFNQRQARIQEIHQAQQHLHARHQAEQAYHLQNYLQAQQGELLAKLPEWKDAAKSEAERNAIKEYLRKDVGLEDALIDNISDHRLVLVSRKAMLYDQMMSKAKAATKKVENLPQRVERPGGGETNISDGRTTAMKRLAASGSIQDAAKLLERLF